MSTVLALRAADPAPVRRSGVRVLLVSQNALVASALAGLLESSALRAATAKARDADQAAAFARTATFDVVIVEIGLPRDTASVISNLRQAAPGVPVVVIAETDAPAVLAHAIDCGASGVLTRAAEADDLTSAVQGVIDGHLVLGHRVSVSPGQTPGGNVLAMGARLTPSELEILAMLGAAWSTDSIAGVRRTSLRTARNHIASIYRKLHISSRAEAVRRAAQMGLVDNLRVRAT